MPFSLSFMDPVPESLWEIVSAPPLHSNLLPKERRAFDNDIIVNWIPSSQQRIAFTKAAPIRHLLLGGTSDETSLGHSTVGAY
jgi:hypothetical protein